jgi:sentrin-specific protease 7
MDTTFYTKLALATSSKEAHNLVARWTKRVNLFDMDYILIPINLNLHWSLCIVCKPKQWIQQASSIDSEACFLHLDSLYYKSHKTETLFKNITNYLSIEWKVKNVILTTGSDDELFRNLPKLQPRCAKQINGYDCGVYTVKFVEKFLEAYPQTTPKDRKLMQSKKFESFMFTPEEVTQERIEYKKLLTDLARQYKNLNI